jgi:outer membrane protein TolC
MVNEKRLEEKKLFLIQDMLKEGIAIQIKNELNSALIGFKQIQTLKKAKKLAKSSRELNVRGYQVDAIEPQKVIEAQYFEAYIKSDYLKYVHDYLLSLAKIDKLIGQEVK